MAKPQTTQVIEPKKTAPEKMLTVPELAVILRQRNHWVYSQLRKKGAAQIPHYKAGKYRLFRLSEVLDWMRA